MKYPLDIPPPGDMTRKLRMKRLETFLKQQELYVHAVPIDKAGRSLLIHYLYLFFE
jgi:hypothetical protein